MTHKRCRLHPQLEPKLVLTPEIKHYGKYICPECSKWITWARDLKTTDELMDRQALILVLLDTHKDHRHFLCTIYALPHLNLVQQGKFNDIIAQAPVSDSDHSFNQAYD
jgi:hypothetical protein